MWSICSHSTELLSRIHICHSLAKGRSALMDSITMFADSRASRQRTVSAAPAYARKTPRTAIEPGAGMHFASEKHAFDLHVRGVVPDALDGRLIIAASRRNKNRRKFYRWHDSQADLIRLDLVPGKPGRVHAEVLSIDPFASDVGFCSAERPFYSAQPNHGVNWCGKTIWATNLLFGAPVQIDLEKWEPEQILRFVEPRSEAPQTSSTSHFAWSLDRRYAYFHQSLLERDRPGIPVKS